ncbi:DUF2383 domain-containing protein [Neptunomonas concharum]|uniref:DUF2383 domain-containing protein n=1 Tax=Neptunomonas concharum TaxID=1031538 RepID=A0A5P1RD05_9GAMM|nr:DUF2383 domain-containing protein [Neptunomonas concharum]QEQ97508.1 DUF2383 domain-containing protein [Neptunomonas concharum]
MSGTYDHDLLDKLIEVCQEGSLFYHEMSQNTKNLALASLFREIASCRAYIVSDLSTLKAHLVSTSSSFDEVVDTTKTTYKQLKWLTADIHSLYFVEQLELAEEHVINTFRAGVQNIKNALLAEKLALHIATLQLLQDKLKAYKVELEKRSAL